MTATPRLNEPLLVVLETPDAAAAEAAKRIAKSLADAVRTRGRVDWVTTGGSTVSPIYRRLAAPPVRDVVPWSAVRVWWGDDRYVPRDHPLSNVKPLDDLLLDRGRVPLPVANLHPFPVAAAIGGMRDAGWAAAQAAAELRTAHLPTADGWPVLDLILLGIGVDGHVLSVFPGSMAFESTDWALAIPAPTHIGPHVERITLNPAILGVARQILVVATGSAKAPVLATVFGTNRNPNRWPAQLARRASATWILDRAAAADLPW
jgi:6-phosphogluconolactonase